MQTLDTKFFDEYKKFDALCGDMLSSRAGVTDYINAMEADAARGRKKYAAWDADLKELKRLRHIRNRLAHEADASGLVKQDDLRSLRALHSRFSSGKDPLSALKGTKSGGKKSRAGLVIALIIILAVLAAVLWLVLK